LQAETHSANSDRKRIIGRAAAVFFAVMLLLTFFSNTLNNFLLPRVKWENPESGQLVKEISGTGRVRPKTTVDRYAAYDMKVLNAAVRVGETVKKGQVLLELDTSGIEEQLANERTLWQQKKLNVEKLTEEAAEEGMRSYDSAVEAARIKMENAERNYENAQALYEAGAEAKANVINAGNSYENARLEYQNALDNRTAAAKNNRRNLQNAQYELEMQERKLRKLEKEMELGHVEAPADGTVMELNFPEGSVANSSKPLFVLADTSQGFEFCAVVDSEAAGLLSTGDEAEVSLDSLEGYILQGTVAEIAESREERGVKKEVLIDIPAENLIGGESGSAEIKKSTGAYGVLVPNSAVGQDISGYFVYVIKERKGPLSNEFFVRRIKVSAGESDNSKTAIVSGLDASDRVITGSDKPVSDGMRVVLENE
jgi:HlyD family secretion protein